jgi:hypothetical protein
MSLRILSSLNKPQLVLATGCAITAAFPFVPVGGLSLGLLKVFNILAFATNVAAVSVPGRIDGDQEDKMRSGDLNPTAETTSLMSSAQAEKREADPMAQRERSLVLPAGWAFAIWGPIYLGEAAFCAAQFVDAANLSATLPQVTAPFVAANLVQALWCASFRPSYNEGWHKYVSVAMLGGTACSLSQLPGDLSWFFVPMVMHFGWTTAATLVNLNGSLAMEKNVPDYGIVASGHASVVLAAALGVSVTAFQLSTPAYGLTVAWALAAVAKGIKVEAHEHDWSDSLLSGAKVQRALCWTGSILCLAASGFAATFLQ